MRSAVAASLATLLLTLSVAVPLVERADVSHAPVVESEHQPGSCPRPHDHRVCTQLRANQAAPKAKAVEGPMAVVRRVRASADVADVPGTRGAVTRTARAPPSA
jgi:hypothetical protein